MMQVADTYATTDIDAANDSGVSADLDSQILDAPVSHPYVPTSPSEATPARSSPDTVVSPRSGGVVPVEQTVCSSPARTDAIVNDTPIGVTPTTQGNPSQGTASPKPADIPVDHSSPPTTTPAESTGGDLQYRRVSLPFSYSEG